MDAALWQVLRSSRPPPHPVVQPQPGKAAPSTAHSEAAPRGRADGTPDRRYRRC